MLINCCFRHNSKFLLVREKAEGVIVVSQVGVTFNNGATINSGSAVGSTATVGIAAGTGSEDGIKHPTATSDFNKVYYYANVVSGSSTIEKAAKGTRTVKAVILDNDDKSVTLTGSFNIVDSQPAVTGTANTSTVSLNTLSTSDVENAIKKALTFKVNGKTINEDAEDDSIRIVGVKTTGISMVTGASVGRLADGKSIAAQNNYTNILGRDTLQAGDKITIGTVLIQYKLSNSHSYVWYEVPVNRILNITK